MSEYFRFLWYIFRQKKKAWQQTLQQEEETVIEIRDESNTSASAIHDLLAYPEDEKEPRGILKKAGLFENLRDPEKRITFVDCTVGGSASDTSSSEDDMFEGPFPEPKIPTELEPDHQFQQHIIKAFIGKTIGKTKHRSKDSDDSSDSSDDDSFLIQKSKKHKKQRPVKTVAALDSNGHGTEKNGMKIGTPKPDSQVIVQRMEMGVNKELEQDTKELNFVENHYRNSFCSGTEQRDDTKVSNVVSSADNVNDRNTPENNARINTDTRNNYENTIVTEENRNSEITVSHENVYSAPNGFHQSVLSGSPQHACINDDSSENGRRLVDDNKVPKVSEFYETESAENWQNSAVYEENDDIDKLQEKLNELNPDIEDGVSSNCDNLVDSNGAAVNSQGLNKVSGDVYETGERLPVRTEMSSRSSPNTMLDKCVMDVPFMGKLVRTQVGFTSFTEYETFVCVCVVKWLYSWLLCPQLWFRGILPSHACHVLWSVHARVLKFHLWIPHGKK